MKAKALIFIGLGLVGVAGCSPGDTNLNISTVDNSVDNSSSGGGSNNPCAAYLDPTTGATRQGSFDGSNCTCLLYTSPSPRDRQKSRMPSSA